MENWRRMSPEDLRRERQERDLLEQSVVHDRDILQYFCGEVLWGSLDTQADVPELLKQWENMLKDEHIEDETLLKNNEDWAKALQAASAAQRKLLV